jgi:hypothetical protein
MKKLNGFESMLVIQGLGAMRESMRNEIIEAEAKGKIPIMTVGYVDMIIDEAIEKIKLLTLKQK